MFTHVRLMLIAIALLVVSVSTQALAQKDSPADIVAASVLDMVLVPEGVFIAIDQPLPGYCPADDVVFAKEKTIPYFLSTGLYEQNHRAKQSFWFSRELYQGRYCTVVSILIEFSAEN